MLQAGSERAAPLPGAARLWVPGMSPVAPADGAGPSTARVREIARRREEMLGMLRDLPEAEYELSLTDLVDKTAAAGGNSCVPPLPIERKEASPSPLGLAERSASGGQAEPQQQQAARTTEKRGPARRRWEGGSGLRSSSDGVLLNFYMPRSFTRSFTAPRPARPPSFSNSGRAASAVAPDDCNKRERDGDTVRCWPLPWDRRWRKSSRRRQDAAAATSGELSAMLTAADHSHPADKV